MASARADVVDGGDQEIEKAETLGSGSEIFVIEPVTAHGEETEDITPLPVGHLTPPAVPVELAEDLVLR
jgi:hypothetical protein